MVKDLSRNKELGAGLNEWCGGAGIREKKREILSWTMSMHIIHGRSFQSKSSERGFNSTSAQKILYSIYSIVSIASIVSIVLEPHYNIDFGVHRKSVLKQNSVIMRVVYTGSIGSGS